MEEQEETSTTAPEVYAEDVVEISRRMKEIAPTILIGANALHTEDWTTILNRAAEHIDFLVVHPCPFYGWEGYDRYLRQDPDTLYCVRWARDAIRANPVGTRRQLKIMVTEFAAGAFNEWDRSGADVARGIMTVDMLGQLLQSQDCHMSLFWNTINIYEGDGSVFNALMRDNTLSAVGRALIVWGRFLEDEMVETSISSEGRYVEDAGVNEAGDMLRSSTVRCYASKTDGKALDVILINKDLKDTPVRLILRSVTSADKPSEKWVYRGTSPTDKNPAWGKVSSVQASGDTLATTLDPVSVTVLSFPLRPNYGLQED